MDVQEIMNFAKKLDLSEVGIMRGVANLKALNARTRKSLGDQTKRETLGMELARVSTIVRATTYVLPPMEEREALAIIHVLDEADSLVSLIDSLS